MSGRKTIIVQPTAVITKKTMGMTTLSKKSLLSFLCQREIISSLAKKGMGRFDAGFTLVELMITMVIFVIVIAAASQIFTGLLTQFKQQSKIAETNIEGVVGLEILRQDIGHAGYGLPWRYPSALSSYSESTTSPFPSLNDSASNPPRAILSVNNPTTGDTLNNSDYLVIKSVNVAQNDTAQRWTILNAAPFTAPYNPRQWSNPGENLGNTENVIVLSMGATTERNLVMDASGGFSTTFGNVTSSTWAPADQTTSYAVYGITPSGTAPQRPFNRADYYIRTTDSNGNNIVPQRCAPNTGVLTKAVVNHSGGTFAGGIYPLLDCVADMQVIFRRNTGLYTDNLATLTDTNGNGSIDAQEIREQITEVRVYVLAHEGQRDVNYTYRTNSIEVGEFGAGRPAPGFDLSVITNWQNYRWKVYTLVVNPNNLR